MRIVVLSALLSALLVTTAQADTTFQRIIVDPNPGLDSVEKALANIQGNGKLNPVVGVAEGSGGLFWYEPAPSGNLADPWIKHKIADGQFYEDAIPVDVNGDGAVDLIISNQTLNAVVWYENPAGSGGNPASDPWPLHIIRANGGTHNMHLADIDGDGRPDLVVSRSDILGTRGAVLFQNNPDSWTEVPIRFGQDVALLDTGNGLGAVNIASGDGDTIVWWENPRAAGGNARTGQWAEHTIAQLPGADQDSIASGVLSSSGRMDVIVANNESSTTTGIYRLIAPDNRTTIWQTQTIDPSYQAVHRIDIADMDNDGNLDLVVAEQEQAGRRLAVFYGDGQGGFHAQVLSTDGGHNQVVGDVNGDGKLDILNANHGVFGVPNPVELWLNNPEKLKTPPPVPPPPQASVRLQDGGFEKSAQLAPYWAVIGNPDSSGVDTNKSHARAGHNSGFLYDQGSNGQWISLSQTVQLQANTDYTLSVWADANNTSQGLVGIQDSSGAWIGSADLANSDPGPITHRKDYQHYVIDFNSGDNTSGVVSVGYSTPGQPSFVNVDQVTLKKAATPSP